MAMRTHHATTILRFSLYLTLGLGVLCGLCLPLNRSRAASALQLTPFASFTHQPQFATRPTPVRPPQFATELQTPEPQTPEPQRDAARAAAYERGLRQACALPAAARSWLAWGTPNATAPRDLCHTATELRAHAAWLAALPETGAAAAAAAPQPALHFGPGAVAQTNAGLSAWVGAGPNGLWRGTATGWQQLAAEPVEAITVNPLEPQTLYALRADGRWERSADGGATFAALTTQPLEPAEAERFARAPLAFHPTEATHFWLGGRALWLSENGGATWQALRETVAGSASNRVSALTVGLDWVLAGTREGWLQRLVRDPKTQTFQSTHAVLPRRGVVAALAAAPDTPQVVFAAYASPDGAPLWRSLDGGVTWHALTGLPELPIHALVMDPTQTGRVFVGTAAGVFVTEDAGERWARAWAGSWVTALSWVPGADGAAQLFAFANEPTGARVWTTNLAPATPRKRSQSAGPPCLSQLQPRQLIVPPAGGRQTITVGADSTCTWTVQVEPNAVGWVNLESPAGVPGSGQGNGQVTLNVLSNEAYTPRSGTLTIGGFSIGIVQQGALNACQVVPLTPGETITGQVNLDDCYLPYDGQQVYYADQFRLEGHAGEMVLVLLQSLTSNAGMSYSLSGPLGTTTPQNGLNFNQAGFATLPATGSYLLQVSGNQPQQTVNYRLNLQLFAPGCEALSASALDQRFEAAGGSGRLLLSTARNCAWQAATSATWLTLAQANGTGSSEIRFHVAENLGTTPRSALIQLGSQQVVITQAGRFGGCAPLPLTPNQPVNGELASGDCPYAPDTAPSDAYVFRGQAGDRVSADVTSLWQNYLTLTLLDARGKVLTQGYGSLTSVSNLFPVPPYLLPEDGNYTVTVSSNQLVPYTLSVNLFPAECLYSVTPARSYFPTSGGTALVQLQTGAQCPWRLQPSFGAEWLTLETGVHGTGPRTLEFRIPANPGPKRRMATLMFGEQTVQFVQAGAPDTCDIVPLMSGQSVQDALTHGDCPFSGLPPNPTEPDFQLVADRFSFYGTAGQVFSFVTTTANNAPNTPGNLVALRYALLDPQGKLLAGGQTDLNQSFPSFVLPVTGAYQFELGDVAQNYPVNYQLTIYLGSAACSANMVASATGFAAAGGSGTLQITAPPGCPWRVLVAQAPRQFSLLDPAEGSGSSQVRFTLGPSTSGRVEPVFLYLGQQSLLLTQGGQGGECQARPLPDHQFVSGQLTLADCPLRSDWLTNSANNRPGHRYTFAGQAGEQIALSSPRIAPPQLGAAVTPSVSLYDPDGQLLNDSSTARALNGQYLLAQTGSYTVEVTAPPNTDAAGTTWEYQLLLERLSAGCLYTANAGLQRFSGAGGSGSFQLLTGGSCQWTPRVNADWVRLEQPPANSPVSGSALVRFSVAANPTPSARTATIVVGGQLIELEQAGAAGDCAILPLPPNQSVDGVSAPSDCRARVGAGLADFYEITVRANDRWRLRPATAATLTVTYQLVLFDPAWRLLWQWSGTTMPPAYWLTLPPGSYYLQVSASSSASQTPYTLTLEQEAGTCSYALLPGVTRFFNAGGASALTLLTGPGCPWTATADLPFGTGNWLTVTPTSGSGSATLNYQVQPFDAATSVRRGSIQIGQLSSALTQVSGRAPASCETTPLTLGQSVSGMLTPADCVAEFVSDDLPNRADRFSFTPSAGQYFAVEVTSSLPLTLTLYDAARKVLARDTGSYLPLGTTQYPASQFLLAPGDQTYYLELAYPSASQVLNYTVRLVTPSSCVYTLTQLTPPTDQPLSASGGPGRLQVHTLPGCAWQARRAADWQTWLSFPETAAGVGPGQFEFTLAPNPNAEYRVAGISLGAGVLPYYLGQLGQGGACQPRALRAGELVRGTLLPGDCANSRLLVNNSGPPYNIATTPRHRFTFSAEAGMQLIVLPRGNPARQNFPLRLTLFDPPGQPLVVEAVTIPSSYQQPQGTRLLLTTSGTYTLELAGQAGEYEFVLDLLPSACGFVLESNQAQISSAGGSGTASVRTQSHCSWTAYATDPWITLGQTSGTGDGTITFTVAPNAESSEVRTRLGFLRLGGQSLPLVQAGAEGSCAPLPIQAGASLTGEITPRDCLRLNPANLTLAQPVDRYSFTGRAGEQALVKVVSNDSLGVQIVPLAALTLSSATGVTETPRQPVDWFGTASLTIPADGTYVIEVMPALGLLPQVPYTLHLEVNAPGCGIALAETQRQFGPAATTAALPVTTAPGCGWQVYAQQDWITVNGARERIGPDTVNYTLSANPQATARWGALLAGGQLFVIEQAGGTGASAGTCAPGAIAAGQTVYGNLAAADCRALAAGAETQLADRYEFNGNAGDRVQISAWLSQPRALALRLFDAAGVLLAQQSAIAASPVKQAQVPLTGEFVTLPSSGRFTIEISLLNLNPTLPPVSYALSLVSAPPGCTYTVQTVPLRFDANGGTTTLQVLTHAICPWTPTLSAAWVSSNVASMNGNGTFTLTVAPNPNAAARQAWLLLGGLRYAIEQAGSAGQCLTRPLTPNQFFSGRLDEQDCSNLSLPNGNWPPSGVPVWTERFSFSAQANDRLQFTLTANDSGHEQTEAIALRLYGPDGAYVINGAAGRLPAINERTVLPKTGTYEIELRSALAASYTALLSLQPNACQYSVSPRQLQFEAAGDSAELSVSTGNACAWRASSDAAWLSVDSPGNGTGAGTLRVRAAANPAAVARTAKVIVGDQTLLVEQAGSGGRCALRTLPRNAITRGQWDAGDCGAQTAGLTAWNIPLRYQDRYLLQATAGERLSLTLQTAAATTQVELYDEQGQLLSAVNGKRLPGGAGEFMLPSTGTYTVRVASNEAADYSLLAGASGSCTVTVTPNPLLVSGAGGVVELQVTTSSPSCAWAVQPSTNWVALPNTVATWNPAAQLFSGSRSLALTLAPNLGPPRTGAVWLADQLIQVQQETRQLMPVAEPLVCVNAATFTTGALAPELLVSAFGTQLANETRAATGWTYNLADTTVTVTDQTQITREAYVLFVSPTQVNFVVPTGLAPGPVTVAITSAAGYITRGTLPLASVAPGLFAANASGSGWASGLILRVKADGAQSYEPLTQYDPAQNRLNAVPITVDTPGESVYLLLFGTGLRGRSDLAAVSAQAGALSLPVSYCGPVPGLLGLDQVNLSLPATLAGSGTVSLALRVEGQAANALRLQVR